MPNRISRPYLFLFLLAICGITKATAQQYYLFAGTYTSGSSEGIYVFKFDGKTGNAIPADTVRNIENPSYLAITNDGKNLYAVTENGGGKPGMINAFSFDQLNGKLSLLNQKESKGDHPCYITVSNNRKWVIAGNYSGGNLVAYATNSDGSLSDHLQLIGHSGRSANKDRQESPHVHSTNITPDQKYLLVPDLGIDKIMTYQFNSNAQQNPLQPAVVPFTAIKPGGGPRHLAFHPNGKWIYLMEELSGHVTVWTYKNGMLNFVQEIDAHTENFKGERGSADIHVSPDGRHVYASNRGGANNLAIFKTDPINGRLSLAGFQDVLGKTPRNFTIEPGGKFVLVANQDSGNITIFSRDAATGLLTPTQATINVDHPVCLQLLRIKN